MPEEIVIADGGSEDGTLEELNSRERGLLLVRVFVAPGANIAAGRNIAVREARHDWIACTDAGRRPVPRQFVRPTCLAARRLALGHRS